MQFTKLGQSDLHVSRLCMGTAFRSEPDEQTCIQAIHAAAELGCNFLDCANVYRGGYSEEIVGRAIRDQRDQFVLTTKVGSQMPRDATTAGLKRDNILACCEASLKRLGTDYIDCYICHTPDRDTPIDETLSAFDQLVRQGKVRYPGVSNYPSWRLFDALQVSRARAGVSPVCDQVCYNLLDRRIEDELVPFCEQFGVGITAYAPTSIGLLNGRFRFGQPPPAGTSWHRGPYNFRAAMTPPVGQAIDAVIDISQRYGKTPLQVALAWCLRHPVVNAAIIGTDKPEMAKENFAAGDWVLPPEAVKELDEVSAGHCLIVRHDCPGGYEAAVRDRG